MGGIFGVNEPDVLLSDSSREIWQLEVDFR